jgi:protein phosphatase
MIRASQSHLHISALTHAGQSGKNNEDRFFVGMFRVSKEDPRPAVVALVCDGIGGHRAGEVAAELAVERISRTIALSSGREPLQILRHAIEDASQAIATHAASRSEARGMGCTCACAWVIDERLYTAHVGDSRLYLLRDDRIRKLSKDHTWVQEAMDNGLLDERQAESHPNAHVLRRHLGSDGPPQVDFRLYLGDRESDEQARRHQGLTLRPGDVVIVCSDGLTDELTADDIKQTLRSQPDLERSAAALVALANHRGGPDNITLVLLEVPAWAGRRKRGGGLAGLLRT